MSQGLPAPIVRARVQIMLEYPFLATAVARLPIERAPAHLPVAAGTDGYHVLVDAENLAERPESEIRFILLHEVMHVILGHMDRRGDRRFREWSMAVDYATNLLLADLGLEVPPGALCQRSFTGNSAEQIYEYLVRASTEPAEGRSANPPERRGKSGDIGPSDDGLARGGLGGEVLEGHLMPDDPRLGAATAVPTPAAAERQRLRTELAVPIREKLRGVGSGHWMEEINAAESSRISWKNILSSFVTELRYTDYRMFPFNKKHLWRGLFMPSVGEPGPDHLVLAIDTSGSMSKAELAVVLGEIDQLRRAASCRLTLVHCDWSIQSVETYDRFEPLPFDGSHRSYGFLGRGGTRFEPVFELLEQAAFRAEHGRFDALFYYTDGAADFPTDPPDYPVFWLISRPWCPWSAPADLAEDVPFGRVVTVQI